MFRFSISLTASGLHEIQNIECLDYEDLKRSCLASVLDISRDIKKGGSVLIAFDWEDK